MAVSRYSRQGMVETCCSREVESERSSLVSPDQMEESLKLSRMARFKDALLRKRCLNGGQDFEGTSVARDIHTSGTRR
jgi:hypothetical protein